MADNRDTDTPNRSANRDKAEGERWTSDSDTVEVADRNAEGAEDTGGISNRPLSEETKRQESLPARNTNRGDKEASTDE